MQWVINLGGKINLNFNLHTNNNNESNNNLCKIITRPIKTISTLKDYWGSLNFSNQLNNWDYVMKSK